MKDANPLDRSKNWSWQPTAEQGLELATNFKTEARTLCANIEPNLQNEVKRGEYWLNGDGLCK